MLPKPFLDIALIWLLYSHVRRGVVCRRVDPEGLTLQRLWPAQFG
jgi:hypothetical protein